MWLFCGSFAGHCIAEVSRSVVVVSEAFLRFFGVVVVVLQHVAPLLFKDEHAKSSNGSPEFFFSSFK